MCCPSSGTGSMRIVVSREVTGGMRVHSGPTGESMSRHLLRPDSWGWDANSCMSRSRAPAVSAASSRARTYSAARELSASLISSCSAGRFSTLSAFPVKRVSLASSG